MKIVLFLSHIVLYDFCTYMSIKTVPIYANVLLVIAEHEELNTALYYN